MSATGPPVTSYIVAASPGVATSSEEQYWMQVQKFLKGNKSSFYKGLLLVAYVRVAVLGVLFFSVMYLQKPRWVFNVFIGALIGAVGILEVHHANMQMKQVDNAAKEKP